MTFQQLIEPDNTNRQITDYSVFADQDGRELDIPKSSLQRWVVKFGTTVTAGDVVFLNAPTAGAPGTGFPLSVQSLPAAPTATQLSSVIGVAVETVVGAASAAAASHPLPTVGVVGSPNTVAKVKVEAAVTPAVGDRVVWTGGTTAGAVNKSTAAIDATIIVGTIGGVFVSAKIGATNFAYMLIRPL